MIATRRRVVLALATGAAAGPAGAAIHWRVPPYLPDRSPAFVQRMAGGLVADLQQRQAKCALVFRAGLRRADMPPETAYTHGAIWLRRDLAPALAAGDDPADPTDAYVVFGLWAGDGHAVPRSRSVLQVERPDDFMRRAIENDVAVVVPTAPLQERLAAIVASPAYDALRLPRYSVLANPLQLKFQNCDAFLLYLVGAAAWQTDDPQAIRAHLAAADFQPTLIRTPRVLSLLAPLVDDRISMTDQSGEVRTASWESISRFMVREDMTDAAYVFRDPGPGGL